MATNQDFNMVMYIDNKMKELITKEEFGTLKTMVTKEEFIELFNKVNNLEKSLLECNNRLKNLENYNKNKSDAYEEQTLNILYDYLSKHINVGTEKLEIIYLKMIYDKKDNHITDLDGCILLNKNFTKLPLQIIEKKLNQTPVNLKSNLQKQKKSYQDDNMLYIVESKNHIIKSDVDMKIKQMITFQCFIKEIKNNKPNLKPKCLEMVNTYNIESFPEQLYLYIASDCISPKCISYITEIYKGMMTAEKYETMTYEMLMQYKGFKDYLKDVPRFTQIIPKINNYSTVIELLNKIPVVQNDEFNKGTKFFQRFCTPFTSLQTTFKWAKNKIGIITQNKVIELLQDQVSPHNVASLNQESISENAPTTSLCMVNLT